MATIISYLNNNKESLQKSLKALDFCDEIMKCHGHIHILYMIIEYLDEVYNRVNIRYLEIGTFQGGSLSVCMQFPKQIELTGIDFFNEEKGHRYSLQNATNNIEKFNIYDHQYRLISGDSTHESTYEKLTGLYDIIFIDGDHSYDGVIKDFNIYRKYIKKKSFIVFDDYHSMNSVPKAVNDIVKTLDRKEWIIHGSVFNLLPNKCSRLHFKNHPKADYLDDGDFLMNNEYIIEKF